MPWGGNPMYYAPDGNVYNSALKDPLVSSSDGWNFPSGQPLNASWLGQVHRGTPWQTIYLKPADILESGGGLSTWMNWTGDPEAADASAMSPAQDWHLASLLASMFNTNDFRSLVSVNAPDPNAWLVLLDGLTALTNAAPGEFDAILVSSNSPQASIIADAVHAARNGQPNGFFRDAGDILSVSQLTTASPFLNAALFERHQRCGLRGNSEPASVTRARRFHWLGGAGQRPGCRPIQRLRRPRLCDPGFI